MRSRDRIIAAILFFAVLWCTYQFDLYITDVISHNLTTFFSVVFGFYVTAMAIIYNSKFLQTLHEEDIHAPKKQKKIHTLREYFQWSGYWAIFSILSVIVYSIVNVGEVTGRLVHPVCSVVIPVLNSQIDIGLLINSIIFSIATVNVYFMILILNTMIDGLVIEARSKK